MSEIYLPKACLHQPAQTAIRFGCEQQMHMIGHQHVCVDGDPGVRRQFREQRQVTLAIGGVAEGFLPIVAALNHMVRMSGRRKARQTGHETSGNNMYLTPIFGQISPMANRRRCSLIA
jgi:hypothetical protein